MLITLLANSGDQAAGISSADARRRKKQNLLNQV
jgi:hypothetical protein